MTDPHADRGADGVSARRPGVAHLICTVRRRFARRHTPDVVVELGLN